MRKFAVVVAALSLATAAHAAAPSAKPAPGPVKPGPNPAAASSVKIANFDARDPASVIALFGALGAKASVARSDASQVFLSVSTPGGAFGAQMIGCDAKGKACHAIAMFTTFEKKGVSLEQINDFNRSQMACRGIMTPDGKPSVMYATLVNLRMTSDETRQHMGVWQGCLNAFGEFTRDPTGFLSRPH